MAGMARGTKQERQRMLKEMVRSDPFLTDEELSERLCVSVPTIRLDRMELGIDEHRKRIKQVAERNYQKVRSIGSGELVGELLDITPNRTAISMLNTNSSMVFEKSAVVRGQFLYSMAETLAIAVIDANAALVGVANIKYKKAVVPDTRLVAKAEVKRKTGNSYVVWVIITDGQQEVFRGKFILVAID